MERFHWEQTADLLQHRYADHDFTRLPGCVGYLATPRGTAGSRSGPARIELPQVLSAQHDTETVEDFIEELPHYLGVHLVILIQAGAAALGVWDDGDLIHHKTIKKYMVRGNGHFQGTHLKTKGKSRYGSRLRLRNASLFLDEINEKIAEWQDEAGGFDEVFASCPIRLWADLKRAKQPFPLPDETEFHRIPMDVHVPSHKELLHVYYELSHGRITPAE